ncbi:HECT domain [Trypanosoma vivax]|nr:HECT domain [Trypanosoma vivax]
MEQFFSRLMMDSVGPIAHRRELKEITSARESLEADDEGQQIDGLAGLCNLLNMATPLTISAIRPSVFVPLLLNCMRKEHNIDLVLLAARALTYMVDAISSTVFVVVSEGGVEVLLTYLRDVKDIELLEQCMMCLEKITQNTTCASVVLEKGGVSALLMFVDFLSSASQRKAWSSVVAMCRRVSVSNFASVDCSLADIRARVQSEDSKIAEKAILCMYRIIFGVRENPELVARVFGDICPALIPIFNKTDVEDGTIGTVLLLIATAVSSSTEAARHTIESGLVEHLFALTARSFEQRRSTYMTLPLSPSANEELGRGVEAGGTTELARRLNVDQTKALCASIAGLLPKISRGYLAHDGLLLRCAAEHSEMTRRSLGDLVVNRGMNVAAAEEEERNERGEENGVDEDERGMEEEEEEEGEDEEEEGEDEDEDEDGNGGDEEEMEGDGDGDGGGGSEVEEKLTREEILACIAQRNIPLERNEKYASCRLLHYCDGCGKNCLPDSWFRCNKCADFDFCGPCLIANWESHTEDGHPHSFCDMFEAMSIGPQSSGPVRMQETDDDTLTVERQRLYSVNPHMLVRVLDGISSVVTLFNESESFHVRSQCLVFINRAITLATPEQLRECRCLAGAAISELIVTAMKESNIVLNVHAIYLCRQLLEKLPDVYVPYFVREGVANVLQGAQQQSQFQTTNDEEKQANDERLTLLLRLSSVAGWRNLIASETRDMLSMFTSLSDDSRISNLKMISKLLREGKLIQAFESLHTALLDDITTFELTASDLLHSLVRALQSANDINVVVALVRTLMGSDNQKASVLTRFVRHLQTALSNLDQFQAPRFGNVTSVHAQIPMRLVPHSAAASHTKRVSSTRREETAQGRGAPGGGAAPQVAVSRGSLRESSSANESIAAASSAQEGAAMHSSRLLSMSSRLPLGRPRRRGLTSTQDSVASEAERSLGDGAEVRVGVEPLTSMEMLMNFVANSVLSGGLEGRGGDVAELLGRRSEEEVVEEVLPDVVGERSVDGDRRSSKSGQDRQHPAVHLRCGKYVLPPSLSVLQLLQNYHTPSTSKKRSRRHTERLLSRQPNALAEVLQFAFDEVVVLHYSTTPFGPEYTHVPPQVVMPVVAADNLPKVKLPSRDFVCPAVSDVMQALRNEFTFSRRFLDDTQRDILIILGTLYETVRNWRGLIVRSDEASAVGENFLPSIMLSEFINYQHNNKAMRHCSNFLLAGQHITTWAVNLAMDCNFLFSTSTRKYLFDVSFCGTQRSVVQMQENMDKYGIRDSLSAERQQNRIFRLHKEKKRVWRDKALACAMAIMGKKRMSGSVVLEFEYYNENGSGSGPTMEFYTLVSNELREIKLKLWRLSDEAPNDKYYQPHNGVYPQPVPESSPLLEKMESYFFFLGRFMARALLDKRILSIPLSNVVHKMLRGDSCGVYDLIDIDESLGKTILAFVQAARNGSDVVVMPHSTSACRVEDLGLDFTLPGKEFVELREGGATIPLIASNLADYCDLVTEYLLDKGVRRFVCALRRGFNDYIPLCALRMLSVSELREILNGHNKLVKIEDLEAHCQADHGYTMSCRHVRQLFEIIASFNEEEQNAFFHFLTGSSHLPVGGLASLQPKFTIVRKTSSDDKVREQDQLPSAMTCQNYLKLPAYDSKEQMEQKLRLALSEGCGAFLLT